MLSQHIAYESRMTWRERHTNKAVRLLLDAADLAEELGDVKLAGMLREQAQELCEE